MIVPDGFHQVIRKVTVAKHEITLEGLHVRDQVELVKEHFKEPLTSDTIGSVY
jgi:hypothetical protein